MGNSMDDRRLWLAKMKKELMERVSQTKLRSKAKHILSSSSSAKGVASYSTSSLKEKDIFSLPIPPTIFLHVLRDLNVNLLPEEEATLLDCLDTERIAKLHMKKLRRKLLSTSSSQHRSSSSRRDEEEDNEFGGRNNQGNYQDRVHSLLWNNDDDDIDEGGTSAADMNGLPMIDYYSFVQFVSRHCGSWIDSRPDLFSLLSKLLSSLLSPLSCISELLSLCSSFDEKNSGYISFRSFLIVCHRSRFFAHIDEVIIEDLAETLVIDGVGEIQYRNFILQLKGVYSKVSSEKQELLMKQQYGREEGDEEGGGHLGGRKRTAVTIIQQLVENGSDPEFYSLLPLRNYLLTTADLSSLLMSLRDFQRLLREFSIVYQPQELEYLLLEVGTDIQVKEEERDFDEEDDYEGGYGRKERGEKKIMKMVDIVKLMKLLMNYRSPWYERNIPLTKKLLSSLSKLSKSQTNGKGKRTNVGDNDGDDIEEGWMDVNTLEMTNMKILTKIISRINAFSLDVDDTHNLEGTMRGIKGGGSSDVSTVLQTSSALSSSSYQSNRLIEWNIFEYIIKSMGILLTKNEISFLCDISDPFPECDRINPYLLFDLLDLFHHAPGNKGKRRGAGERSSAERERDILLSGKRTDEEQEEFEKEKETLSEAAIYALNHLQTLLWKAKEFSFSSARKGKSSSSSSHHHSPARKHSSNNAFHDKYSHDSDYTSTTLVGNHRHDQEDRSHHHQHSSRKGEEEGGNRRSEEAWKLDIQSVFKGFDYLNNGFIAFQDLLLILKLLNVTISLDLLQDIPYVNVNNELVNYPKLLRYLLDTSHLQQHSRFSLSLKDKYGRNKNQGRMLTAEEEEELLFDEEEDDENNDERRKSHKKATKKSNSSQDLASDILPRPIQLLINKIRHNISIFILNNHSMEEAWMELLKVFTQFDKEEKNYLTSRDFLLAISVLLTSATTSSFDPKGHFVNSLHSEKAEDLLFTKGEWDEIMTYFEIKEENDEEYRFHSRNHKGLPVNIQDNRKINYLFFCEMVLNIKEIERKLGTLQLYLHSKGKSNHLSHRTSSSSSSSSSHRSYSRDDNDDDDNAYRMNHLLKDLKNEKSKDLLSHKTNMMISQQLKDKQASLKTNHSSSSSSYHHPLDDHRPSSASSSSRRQSSPSKRHSSSSSRDMNHDPIAQRFKQSNDKYRSLVSGGKKYGDHSRRSEESDNHYHNQSGHSSSSPPKHIPSSYDNYLKVSKTQGTSSRDNRHSDNLSSSSSSMVISRKDINDRKREMMKENQSNVNSTSHYSGKDLYQSSHKNSNRSNLNGSRSVRFNETY
jgi:Ca2+-binding EF-hand superfamily protein